MHPSSSPSYIVLVMFAKISEICHCLTCVWNSMHSSNIELRNTCYQVNVVCLNSYIVLGMFVEIFESCYCLKCVWNSMHERDICIELLLENMSSSQCLMFEP